jgi:hypothetical protein
MINREKYGLSGKHKKLVKTKGYVNECYNTMDVYRFFRELHSEKTTVMEIQRDLFKKIHEVYTEVLWEHLLKGNKFPIPYTLGKIFIEKRKMRYDPRYLPKDYGHYKKTNKTQKIFFLNEHSNGWRVKLKWDKKGCIVSNKIYYSLSLCRSARKKIADRLREPGAYLHFNERRRKFIRI